MFDGRDAVHLDTSQAYQTGISAIRPHSHKSATGISYFDTSVLPLSQSDEWRIFDVSSVCSIADYGFPCPQLRLYLCAHALPAA